ncbi:MAG: GAF domain-containing protein, partial [Calditrichia bacterium]|nr:GAF domain-containing protein [Calditrichia bacterium]
KIKIRNIANQKADLTQQVEERTLEIKIRNKALKKAQQTSEQFAAQASLLTEVGQRVSGVLDVNILLDEIVTSAQEAFDYYGVMLLMRDFENDLFRLQSVAGGYKGVFTTDLAINVGEGMIGKAAQTMEIQLSNDVSKNKNYLKKVGEVTNSELCVPILIEDKVIAILDIQSDEKNAFSKIDVAMLETFGTQITSAINNAKLYEQSQNEIKERKRAEGELTESRDNLAMAKKETDSILTNVEEGLFLLNKSGDIGSQYSKSLEYILAEKKLADQNFIQIIKKMIPESTFESVDEYLELMFREDIEEETISELNPLSEIELNVMDNNKSTSKYLAFKFKRIHGKKGGIVKLISTVRDITQQITMANQIQEIEALQKKQIEWLLSILHVEAPLLNEFLFSVKNELKFIDSLLKQDISPESYNSVLDEIYRSMHTIKGNAGLLDIKFFTKIAHDFEEEIIILQKKVDLSGRDFVSLVLKLHEIRDSLTEIENLINRISSLQTHFRPKRSFESELFIKAIENMIVNLSLDEGKEIKFDHTEFNPNHIPFRNKLTGKEVLVQLVRNSITHGIETKDIR